MDPHVAPSTTSGTPQGDTCKEGHRKGANFLAQRVSRRTISPVAEGKSNSVELFTKGAVRGLVRTVGLRAGSLEFYELRGCHVLLLLHAGKTP